MYYTDYSIIKIHHNARQAELARAAHNNHSMRRSELGSSGISGRALDRLGNSLDGMGKALKGELVSSS
ncbi:MAG: hypothetical protein R6V73_05160 [Anaerolineales bacterium]|jgi:hypothetical protein